MPLPYSVIDYTALSDDQVDALKQSDGKVRLFNNIVCPFGHRALWTALEVNAPIEYIHIPLKQDKPASFTEKFNRYGSVPFLLDDGFSVYESAVVAHYLDAKFGHGTFHRLSDPQAASVAQLAVSKFEARPLFGVLVNGPSAADALRANLTEVEQIYRDHAKQFRHEGPFLLGATLSSAEINIIPFLFRFELALAHHHKYDLLAEFPLLKAALDAAKARPAFQQSIREPEFYITALGHYVKAAPAP